MKETTEMVPVNARNIFLEDIQDKNMLPVLQEALKEKMAKMDVIIEAEKSAIEFRKIADSIVVSTAEEREEAEKITGKIITEKGKIEEALSQGIKALHQLHRTATGKRTEILECWDIIEKGLREKIRDFDKKESARIAEENRKKIEKANKDKADEQEKLQKQIEAAAANKKQAKVEILQEKIQNLNEKYIPDIKKDNTPKKKVIDITDMVAFMATLTARHNLKITSEDEKHLTERGFKKDDINKVKMMLSMISGNRPQVLGLTPKSFELKQSDLNNIASNLEIGDYPEIGVSVREEVVTRIYRR